MTPERWQRIGALFDRVLAEPREAREGLVRESGEPGDVQDEVLSLLHAHEGGDQFLEPASLFAEGSEIGTYRIIRLLGRGGMGVVYLAEDTRLHRRVALKALPPHLFRDERMRLRLRQEARAAAALSHPSIATVYALEEIGDQLLIATEYLEGQTLRDELAEGPLPLEKALTTALEIARAMEAAHDRGVAHRDLKPENIVRLTSRAVKILDFGLAKFDPMIHEGRTGTHLTDTGMMAGTPRYMAPEQLLGQPTGVRTDQFAFGVLVYELVLGRHPFGSGSLPSIVARVLAGEPDGPTGFDSMPDLVWRVIERCLRKDPADRFGSTSELVEALENAQAGRAFPVKPGEDIVVPSGGPAAPLAPTPLALQAPLAPTPLSPLAPQAPLAPHALWWWTFHQLIATAFYSIAVWLTWFVHGWLGRAGIYAFLATVVAVILSGTLRIHLSFTARTYPTELVEQRARAGPWIRAGDYAFSLATVLIGLSIAEAHNWWGTLFITVGLSTLLVTLVIEPATSRAAFGDPPSLKASARQAPPLLDD